MNQKRIHKGNSLIEFPTSFTVFDIETTGLSPKFDEIIELSAIKISNDTIIDSFSSLVKPMRFHGEGYVNNFITKLTGITNEMLSDAPEPDIILREYLDFLGNDILVGHNCASFDINFLYDLSEKIFSKPLTNNFIDTLMISRRLHPEISHHRLSDLCERYSIDYSHAHRALSDCKITAKCYKALKNEIDSNYDTLNQFKQNYTKKRVKQKASDILPSTDNIDITNPLYGKTFVFTGTLEKMPRKDAMQKVINLGCVAQDSVTKQTDFLVLGANDYLNGKSSKQKKVEELILKGYDIKIISEDVFYDMINNLIYKDEFISKATENITILDYNKTEKHTMKMLIKTLMKDEKREAIFQECGLNKNYFEELHTLSICDNKYLRKLLDLPVTKELRYMEKEKNTFVPYKIKNYEIVDWYTESNSASLKITLESGNTIRILGDYFAHMQKPNFESDIKEQENHME